MTIDPATAAGLVTRRVRTGVRAGGPTRTVAATRVYPTDRDDLWDAITDPARIRRWFLPITGQLEVGGRYQLEGNAGGTIESCDAPASLRVTWEFDGSISWVEVALTTVDGGTRLDLAHEAPADPAFWADYGPGATGIGWDLGLLALGWHVEDGEALEPGWEDRFLGSTDGVAFLDQAAADWVEAAIADGDGRDDAVEAGARSATFYRSAG